MCSMYYWWIFEKRKRNYPCRYFVYEIGRIAYSYYCNYEIVCTIHRQWVYFRSTIVAIQGPGAPSCGPFHWSIEDDRHTLAKYVILSFEIVLIYTMDSLIHGKFIFGLTLKLTNPIFVVLYQFNQSLKFYGVLN